MDEIEAMSEINIWYVLLINEIQIAIAIRSLVNARSLQLECARILHEVLLMFVLLYGNETMIWREKERSRML